MARSQYFVLFLGLAALALAGFVHGSNLHIDVTHKPEACELKAANDHWVSVHYVGKLEDGTVFDNSYDRGQEIEFKLGAGQVIAGWDEGIEGMCVNEKRRLIIPPELGYGQEGVGPIPGGATLFFDVELVSISEHPVQPAEDGEEGGYDVYQDFGGEDGFAGAEAYGADDGYEVGGTVFGEDLQDA